jgi:hypothetical protein
MQSKVNVVIVRELILDPAEQEQFDEMLYRVQCGNYPNEKDTELAQAIRISQEDALEAWHKSNQ